MTPDQLALGDPMVNSVGMVLVPIPAGEFQMGSPESEKDRQDDETQHLVKITKPYYLSAYEVTQEQYEKVMGNNPSDSKGANKPVENVNWNDAVDFCRKLSEQEGEEYRLPTEAEWEYACRAGTSTAYSFGNDESQLGKYAWFGSLQLISEHETHPVGEKLPNAWGLYDMYGNVWEWCQDRYRYGAYGSEKVITDPTGPASGSRRVLRGGAFYVPPFVVRSADRGYFRPSWPSGLGDGFRLARTFKGVTLRMILHDAAAGEPIEILNSSTKPAPPDEDRIERALISLFKNVNHLYNGPPRKGIEKRLEVRINNLLLDEPAIEAGWFVYRDLDPQVFALGTNVVGVRVSGRSREMRGPMTIEKLELDVDYR